MIDLRLGQIEPTDMLGFPYIDKERNKSGYMPMDSFPIKGDVLPLDEAKKPYNGWLLFLDELTSAKPEVQAAAYKLILDRMVGNHHLHEKVAIIAAGNLESDNAVVYPMSTALQTRMVHLELTLDHGEWLNWAINKGVDHRITDFIQFKPDALYTFDPAHTNLTYSSPRTWEMADDLLTVCGNNVKDPDFLALASGTVTEGVTREFLVFCDIYTNLPKLADILMAPKTARIPEENSILFALAGLLGNNADTGNIDKLIDYILRLPMEFQVISLRYIIKRDQQMMATPAVSKWVSQYGAELF